MLDIKVVRQNPDLLSEALIKRGQIDFSDVSVKAILQNNNVEPKLSKEVIEVLLQNKDKFKISKIKELEELDLMRRNLLFEVEQLKSERNKASQEIAQKKARNEPVEEILSDMKKLSDKIKELDAKVAEVDRKLENIMLTIPNIPHSTVPIGGGEQDNIEVRKYGAPKDFKFQCLDHVDLGIKLKILDLERASKITGARFSILLGDGARLERAIWTFMLDLHIKKHGYLEMLPPLMVNASSMQGTGQLPKFEEDLFKVSPYNYYLIPTAEVPVTNYFANEIIPESLLTIKMCAYTPCFRSEAGSYGKDTRGLIRQHQFNKVELVKFSHPDKSYEELETLTADAEEVLKLLGLPYRVVVLSTADMGFSSAKTYDIEVWLPSQKRYREISSCSNFEDFQARRANIKFKSDGKNAKTAYVHTLNGSGLAVGRTWVAILENYQDEGGRIYIPDVLRPYMDGKTHIDVQDIKFNISKIK